MAATLLDPTEVALRQFFKQKGLLKIVVENPPRVGKEAVDVYKLYHEVQRRGGWNTINEKDAWLEIANVMLSEAPTVRLLSSPAISLSVIYRRYLLEFQRLEEQRSKEMGGPSGNKKRQRPGQRAGVGRYGGGGIGYDASGLPPLSGQYGAIGNVSVGKLEKILEAISTLSAPYVTLAAEAHAINVLNKLTADGDVELVILESAPDLLDVVADSLDRHNTILLSSLRTRIARQQKEAKSSKGGPRAASAAGGNAISGGGSADLSTLSVGTVNSPTGGGEGAAAGTLAQLPQQLTPSIAGGGGTNSSSSSSSSSQHHAAALAFNSSGRHGGDLGCPPWLDPTDRDAGNHDPGPVVLGLISLIRNLSYIVANEDTIAYHTRILAHLASLVPAYRTEVGAYVMDILTTVSKHLDIGGLPFTEDETGIAEDSLMSMAPPKLKAQRAAKAHAPVNQDFIALVLNILAMLIELIAKEDRVCIIRCLECLSKLLQVEDNAQLVVRYAPASFFVRLHELFYYPSRFLDSLGTPVEIDESIPRYNFENWDSAADVEVRDWSIDVLSMLCTFRELHAKLFRVVPGLMRSLVLLVGTKAGRPEIPKIVTRMICSLASEGRGKHELELLRPLLVHYAFRNEAAAELMYYLYFAPEPLEGGLIVMEGEEE